MRRIFRALRALFRPRPLKTVEQPWSLPPEVVRDGFDQVRSSIPVDDDELRRARPVYQRQHLPL